MRKTQIASPVPEVADLRDLNQLIAAACEADVAHTITGRGAMVVAALAVEPRMVRPAGTFDTTEPSSVRVDSRRW